MAALRRPGSRATCVALLLLLPIGCSTAEPPAPRATTTAGVAEVATVAAVSDGDTLRTTSGRKIRLVQIDAPELHSDCFGKASLAALRKLAPPGTQISLERDPALDATDRYGRQLRYVFHTTNINVALVRQGAASPYFFGGVRGTFARDLLAAAKEARSAKRGFWGACPGARLDPGRGSITGPR